MLEIHFIFLCYTAIVKTCFQSKIFNIFHLYLQGEPKEVEELPDKVNMYSGAVPNTNSGNYGHRNTTETGQALQKLEFQFHSGNRKRKMGNDLICY